ncbi:glycosyltransferase family 4 protein [Aerococcaceae bacterium WGS1372]
MKKMLMLSSVASMIDQFNMNNIAILHDLDVEVHVAANFIHGNSTSDEKVQRFKEQLKQENIPSFQIDFTRNMLRLDHHVQAFKQLSDLIKREQYDFIHCHSPIGGAIGRIVAKMHNVPIIYTAHGFHFYNDSSLMSWLIYYPIEKILSRYTDTLITINEEDYRRASKFQAKNCIYVPGVGIDLEKFSANRPVNEQVRQEFLTTDETDFVILSVGELNKNKNHQVIIKALSNMNNPKVSFIHCGQGELEDELKDLAKQLGVSKQVKFLGFRDDILDIYAASDLFVFPSFREGLPVSLMEAIASGLPVIVSKIRGNEDLVENELGGFLFNPDNDKQLLDAVLTMYENPQLCQDQVNYNLTMIKKFSTTRVNEMMEQLYSEYI